MSDKLYEDLVRLIRICVWRLTRLMNLLDDLMADRGLSRALRGHVLISILSTALLRAIKYYFHADDQHSCLTEVRGRSCATDGARAGRKGEGERRI